MLPKIYYILIALREHYIKDTLGFTKEENYVLPCIYKVYGLIFGNLVTSLIVSGLQAIFMLPCYQISKWEKY